MTPSDHNELNARFIAAARDGRIKVVQRLLDNGADLYCRNRDNKSAMMQALIHNHYDLCLWLLERHDDRHPNFHESLNALFIYASNQKRFDLCKEILLRGADINYRGHCFGNHYVTALDQSVLVGITAKETTLFLLDHGSDIDRQDSSGWTALMMATKHNKPISHKLVGLLLDYHPDVNIRNSAGQTAFWMACNKGDYRVAELLIAKHADIEIPDRQKNTPLLAATRKNEVGIMSLLLKHNANAHAVNDDLETALLLACNYRKTAPVIHELLRKGSFVNSQDYNGYTPLMRAISSGADSESLLLLLDHGADIDIIRNEYKNTALDMVNSRANKEKKALLRNVIEQRKLESLIVEDSNQDIGFHF